jgi:hypothetical protein
MSDMKEMSADDLFVFFAFDLIGVLRCCALCLHGVVAGVYGGLESGLIRFWEGISVHDLCIMASETSQSQFRFSGVLVDSCKSFLCLCA